MDSGEDEEERAARVGIDIDVVEPKLTPRQILASQKRQTENDGCPYPGKGTIVTDPDAGNISDGRKGDVLGRTTPSNLEHHAADE